MGVNEVKKIGIQIALVSASADIESEFVSFTIARNRDRVLFSAIYGSNFENLLCEMKS